MATLSVRVPGGDLARFDAWAGDRGGRAPALRRLMADACDTPKPSAGRLPPRPLKLTVRLADEDARSLLQESQAMGLTPNAWAAALIRNRLHRTPALSRAGEAAVIAIQAEYRRIGVNLNQVARALNTAVMDGKVLDLELAYVEDLRTELRAHLFTLREAFAGNQAYWNCDL